MIEAYMFIFYFFGNSQDHHLLKLLGIFGRSGSASPEESFLVLYAFYV
jgi:hypothetical protein